MVFILLFSSQLVKIQTELGVSFLLLLENLRASAVTAADFPFLLYEVPGEMDSNLSLEEFLTAAEDFVEISNTLCDGWKFIKAEDLYKSYVKKECFIKPRKDDLLPMKAEFVMFFSLSYQVPQFSFNVWNSSGVLLTIEELRQITFIKELPPGHENLYSVITQQEHPIFYRPYFIVHPCRTGELLSCFKSTSANILVTFLGMVEMVIKLNLRLEYGKPIINGKA